MAKHKIIVEPSNNIFRELGNNTYDYKDLLSELIDNSLAARQGEPVAVSIDIFIDNDRTPHRFVIADDASGIAIQALATAISPAAIQTGDSLNEHGLGMKQAVAALGHLESLTTRTAKSRKALQIKEFRFGEIDAEEVPYDRAHGTTLAVRNVKPIVTTAKINYTRTIVPYLGARYRRFLKPDNPILTLTISLRNYKNNAVIENWIVKEVKPAYLHPGSRENKPVFAKFPLKGQGWNAELTFGYAPTEHSEYEELGLEVPNKWSPYRVSISTQGLDVFLHDRVILFHQLSELDIVSQRHNDYNDIRGELVLKKGFSTAITKNAITSDAAFQACVSLVTDILRGKKEGPKNKIEDYLKRKTFPEEIPEQLLRDRLAAWLKSNGLQPKKDVHKEYAVEGVEGFIDVLADAEAWELKREQASALDVYQVFMYMDIGKINKGYLIAKSYSPGALIAAKTILKNHKKEIVLSPRSQYPINDPPSTEEREKYY